MDVDSIASHDMVLQEREIKKALKDPCSSCVGAGRARQTKKGLIGASQYMR